MESFQWKNTMNDEAIPIRNYTETAEEMEKKKIKEGSFISIENFDMKEAIKVVRKPKKKQESV